VDTEDQGIRFFRDLQPGAAAAAATEGTAASAEGEAFPPPIDAGNPSSSENSNVKEDEVGAPTVDDLGTSAAV